MLLLPYFSPPPLPFQNITFSTKQKKEWGLRGGGEERKKRGEGENETRNRSMPTTSIPISLFFRG